MQPELNRIYQGDCLEIMRGWPDKFVDLVVTDPPYLVDWQSNRREVRHLKIAGDTDDAWLKPVALELFRILKDDSLMFSFYGWLEVEKFMIAWKEAGFKPKSHFVCVKNNIGLGWFSRGQHEPAYLLTKGDPEKPLNAISDVINWTGTGNELHPTQKPIDALLPVIRTYSVGGGIVADPFCGSGSTLVACERMGRKWIGIEINPDYAKIAEERIARERAQLKLAL